MALIESSQTAQSRLDLASSGRLSSLKLPRIQSQALQAMELYSELSAVPCLVCTDIFLGIYAAGRTTPQTDIRCSVKDDDCWGPIQHLVPQSGMQTQ